MYAQFGVEYRIQGMYNHYYFNTVCIKDIILELTINYEKYRKIIFILYFYAYILNDSL